MALGYQQIMDNSPLSRKLLNDQLEMLWKKVMENGGVSARSSGAALNVSHAADESAAPLTTTKKE